MGQVIRLPQGPRAEWEPILELVKREVELLEDLNLQSKRITQLYYWLHIPEAKCVVLALERCERSLADWIHQVTR